MKNNYYSAFPKDYFEPTTGRITNIIKQGDNAIICAPVGFAIKTFTGVFLVNFKKDFLNVNLIIYDTPIQKDTDLYDFVKNNTKTTKRNLVFIKYIDQLDTNLKIVLEKLSALQSNTSIDLSFICTANIDPVLNPSKYTAVTETFFKRLEILPAFDFDKTKESIKVNNNFFDWKISEKEERIVYELSGGIPRLIKYVSLNIFEKQIKTDEYIAFYLDPSIYFQLDYLTKLLITEKSDIAKRFGIINEKGNIVSVLLKDYFSKYINVFLQENFVSLTETELKILSYLYENKNKIVTFDKIADLMLMNDYNYSLWAIYKMISRIKVKVKVKGKLIIENIKSSGYKLVEF